PLLGSKESVQEIINTAMVTDRKQCFGNVDLGTLNARTQYGLALRDVVFYDCCGNYSFSGVWTTHICHLCWKPSTRAICIVYYHCLGREYHWISRLGRWHELLDKGNKPVL
ncbi:hypothetical protein BX616_009145, partial [Lobosporangium transversale]